jgi:hypothetical protein
MFPMSRRLQNQKVVKGNTRSLRALQKGYGEVLETIDQVPKLSRLINPLRILRNLIRFSWERKLVYVLVEIANGRPSTPGSS